MPSDCQCSSDRETIVYKEKLVGKKEAIRRIERLEREVSELKLENSDLRRRLRRATVKKSKIVSDLKRQLDRV